MTYTSDIIRETPGAYVRGRVMKKLRQWLWLIVLVLSATVAAACFDSRFIYVALMEVCIVFPMALGPVWISEALGDDARRAVLPHRVAISPQGVCICYEPSGDNVALKNESFGWSDFRSCHDDGKSVILEWPDSKRAGLRIPENAFDRDTWIEVARILAQNL
ncbi:MAG: hypothetical protein K2L80_00480 [Muribaculaceae bacterium]|nr:hypothetical protein [Muribaculaceae bacterium]MDE6331056.1 hypothetical protein [Muribaculaceae bacterium]